MGMQKPNPEQPERVERLLAGSRAAGSTIHRPASYGLTPIAAVHTPEYIEFLTHIFERWQRMEGASAEVIPNVHPFAATAATQRVRPARPVTTWPTPPARSRQRPSTAPAGAHGVPSPPQRL
jgi:acetoin utilization deacetylase AcuC-like enzyme